MPYRGQRSELVTVKGDKGDNIEAYAAYPDGAGPFPGVVVVHHAPGWDNWIVEVVRKFAHNGYNAVAPHLYSRMGPGEPDELAARSRTEGGMTDSIVMGDIAGGVAFLRALPTSNGKVGIIGFCSGGRQVFLAACQVDGIDAAVDCWGGGVIADPATLTERRPVSPIELASRMKAPLLGIFGNDDRNPDVDQVNGIEEVLKKLGKDYEFHRYDGAAHGFFAVDRPNYRPEQATDAWTKVFAFYEKHLSPVGATAGAS
jgi:carboxymethylenebutenolidase